MLPRLAKVPMIEKLTVALGDRSYPIHIGPGALQDVRFTAVAKGKSVVIITDDHVAPRWLPAVRSALQSSARMVREIILPSGEASKSIEHLSALWDQLLTWQCDRKTLLVALGGGVIGDLVGFAAATYQRGIPFVQVPTTLLAQVDSSVGGKTAINHPKGKNMIGAFYQPIAVFSDTNTLNTLPDREFKSGLAEVIKHGLIIDVQEVATLEQDLPRILAREPAALTRMIVKACTIKADIVAQDEREVGVRAWLNLGHTFGHAIEVGLGYGVWLHGEAVAAGCCVAATLSHLRGDLSVAEVARISTLFAAAGLPTKAPRLGGVPQYMELMAHDKKADAGAIHYVLLKALGKATVSTTDDAHVAQALEAHFA